jgi:adsorption protein B
VEGAVWIIDAAARELMLFAGVMLLVGGIDDLLIDWAYLLRRAWRGTERLAIDALPPLASGGRMAVLVPAWRESAVIGAMLTATLGRYRFGDYLILVGCYPNDRETIDAVAAVAEHDARVRLVVGRPGPTTKADNLNALWRALERDDAWSGTTTRAVVIHDAEDVVHPDELCLFARLLDNYDVIQLPVLPLVDPRAPLVSGHYADEFAESHAKQLVIRAALGAGMRLGEFVGVMT